MAYLSSVSIRIFRKVEDKRRSGRVRKTPSSPADEQFLKVMSLRKRKKSSKDLTQRDTER